MDDPKNCGISEVESSITLDFQPLKLLISQLGRDSYNQSLLTGLKLQQHTKYFYGSWVCFLS